MATMSAQHKAKVNAKAADGSTPLDVAIACRRVDIIALLQRNGAKSGVNEKKKGGGGGGGGGCALM